MILPPDGYSEELNILFFTGMSESKGLTYAISLNSYTVFIVALGCKVKGMSSDVFFMFCLGKCLTYCLSETKCRSFQGAAVSGYKKIRASIVLNGNSQAAKESGK